MRVTRDERLTEMLAEEIDAITGVFQAHQLSWTGDDHYYRVASLLQGLVDSGALRRLDLRAGLSYVRTDVPCDIEEPTRVIYRCYDAAGDLLYIGCTADLPTRLYAHSRSKPWWPSVVRVEEQPVAGWVAADASERRAIETELPRFNVLHNPARRPRPRKAVAA